VARTTVKERVLALMADGKPRTVRRIAYELEVGYSTVAQLVREGVLVKIGEAGRRSRLQRRGLPIVVLATSPREPTPVPLMLHPRVGHENA
jgi:hypothetical protein